MLIARLLSRRPSLGFTLQAIYHLAGVVLMFVIFAYSLPQFEKAWRRNTFEGLEGDFILHVWPFKLIILIGAVFCGIQYVRLFREDIKVLRRQLSKSISDQAGIMVGIGSTVILAAVFVVLGVVLDLTPVQVGLVSVLFVLFLVYVGVHVGVALALLSFVCVWMVRDDLPIAGKSLALARRKACNAMNSASSRCSS